MISWQLPLERGFSVDSEGKQHWQWYVQIDPDGEPEYYQALELAGYHEGICLPYAYFPNEQKLLVRKDLIYAGYAKPWTLTDRELYSNRP